MDIVIVITIPTALFIILWLTTEEWRKDMEEKKNLLDRFRDEISDQTWIDFQEAVFHEVKHDYLTVEMSFGGNGMAVIEESEKTFGVTFRIIGVNLLEIKDYKTFNVQSQTPTHYGTDKTDTITYMKQHCSHEEVRGFLKGNVFKYLTRAEKKNGLEDYKKAAHYMTMLLEHAEEKGGEKDAEKEAGDCR